MCKCTGRCMMLAYCVTYSLLQFDNDDFSFLMKNLSEYIHYIQIYTLYTKFQSIWTKIMSTWAAIFVFFIFMITM